MPPRPDSYRAHRSDWTLPLILGIGAAVVAWIGYGRTDLTLDEGYSQMEASLSAKALWHVLTRRELNGSAHTVLLFALNLGDAPAWALRSVSTVIGLAFVRVLFAALRRFGTAAALAGVAVTVLNPDVLFDFVDARGYSLALLAVAGTVYLMFRVLDTGSSRWAAGYGVLCGFTVYTHFFAALVVVAELVWLLLVNCGRWPSWRRTILPLVLLGLPAAVFFITGGATRGQLPRVPALSLHDYVSGAVDLIAGGANGDRPLQALAVVVFLAVVLLGLRTSARYRREVLLGVMGLAFLVATAAVAARAQPAIYSSRYLSVGLPLLGLAVAAALGEFGVEFDTHGQPPRNG
jgi:hypothetical protein